MKTKLSFIAMFLTLAIAFVVAAQSYDVFADAILKKLVTEIAANER